jgi:hypothetical protein
VIVAVGPDVKPFEQTPLLIDLAPTILAALYKRRRRSSTPAECCTRSSARTRASRRRSRPCRSRGCRTKTDASSVTDTEADEMEEHLRGLGYLE